MEISIILTNDSGSLQAILGQFVETAVAETFNDRVLAQQAASEAQASQADAAASRDAAASSAAASLASSNNAATSATSAASSAAAASASRDGAELQATYAQQSATAAANSQTAAAGSASAAAASATSASTSASDAAATLANALVKSNNLDDVVNSTTARNNLGAAARGANSDITSLTGLTTALSVSYGGTGATNAAAARTNLGAGTVNSVALTLPPIFSLTGSPITDSGTFAVTLATQNANTVFAGPTTGSAAAPTFRPLVAADIPSQSGRLIGVQIFTSSGTYTPTTGTNSIIVELQAPGGASGGAIATGTNAYSVGAPGSSGGYIKHRMTSGFAGLSVVIGAPGAPASGAAGGAGGNVSFGTITAGGGGGGSVSPQSGSVAATSGSPGTASGGNILNIPGRVGQTCFGYFTASLLILTNGADSVLGSGGQYAASAGQAYGSGGGATGNGASAAAKTGFAGGAGIVIVWEYS